MRGRLKYIYLSERIAAIPYNYIKSLEYKLNYSKIGMDELKKNADLRGKLNGGRCFVLGNGPSLKNEELSLLKNDFVITCNTAVQLDQFESMCPNAHLWVDDCFFVDSYTQFMRTVQSKSPDIISFFPLKQREFVRKNKLEDQINLRYFNYKYIFCEKYSRPMDFTKTIIQGFSVVEFGIALAIYMGASEIYLLGCDCTGAISHIKYMENGNDQAYAYAYNFTDEEKQRRIQTEIERGNEDFFYNQLKLFHHYRLWVEYCNKRNIKLYNCSAGILREVPHMDFKDIQFA